MKYYVIFNNDWPLSVVTSKRAAAKEIKKQRDGELDRAYQSYGRGTHCTPQAVKDHMARCYFHYHEVPGGGRG